MRVRLHLRMRIPVTALLGGLLLALEGCALFAVAAVGAAAFGVVSYANNEATMEVQTDLPSVFAASKKALHTLSFPVDDTQVATPTEGTLKAGDARVRVERLPGGTTRVRASVGTFDTKDNERRAKLILEEIKKQL